MSIPQTSSTFRAIIVGGGPVGLGLANAFHLAGINYVLLERGKEVIVERGSGIGIWPHSVRFLDQLGIYDQVMGLMVPLRGKINIRPNGEVMARSNMFEEIQTCHGHPWTFLHRRDLLETLYGNLPDKETIRTKKVIRDIEVQPTGVKIHCEDGTVEEGSIIIGADGVHSTVRQLMEEKAMSCGVNLTKASRTLKCQFQVLIGRAGPLPGEEFDDNFEIRGKGTNLQVVPGLNKTCYFFLFKRLDRPTFERTKYSQEQADRFAEAHADVYFQSDMKFGDIWKMRQQANMVNLEEGVIKTWHWDRVVLIGDAAHKVTPNAGLGLNLGWQGAVELTNRLRKLLGTSPNPDTGSLTALFKAYQTARMKDIKFLGPISAVYTRTVSWANPLFRLLDEIARFIGGDITIIRYMLAPIVSRGVVLDFMEESHPKVGKSAWKHQPLQGMKRASVGDDGDT